MNTVPPRLVEVSPRERFRLRVRYSDGAKGEVDLSDLAGRGVFSAWDVPGTFESVRIGPHGELRWGKDLDLCGDAVYLRLTGKAPDVPVQSWQS